MTIFKKTIITALLLTTLILGTASIAYASKDTTFRFPGFKEHYDLYDIMTVPKASFGDTEASATVCFPDGKKCADGEVYLDEGGIYTIEYRAVVDGTLLREEKTFNVDVPLYSVLGGNMSTVSYGADKNDVFGGGWNSGRQGILLSLSPNETFRYNDVINVYDSNAADLAVKFALEPHSKGQADVRAVYFVFTDIYDAENKVTVWMKCNSGAGAYTYFISKANDQPYAGREYHGQKGEIWHFQDIYGTPILYSSGGMINSSETGGTDHAGMYFNREDQTFFLSSNRQGIYFSNDFDDVEKFSDPWDGFTTGEVYLDIYADGYSADNLQMIILGIVGQDISREYVYDSDGPVITVDTGDLTEAQLKKGYAGKEYPLFDASASDKYCGGSVDVFANVFYNYERSESGVYDSFGTVYTKKINVAGGKFKTTTPGKYSIVYRATDWFGNNTEKVYTIEVSAGEEAPEITGLTLGEHVSEASAENIVDLPVAYGYNGGVGKISVSYEISLNGVLQKINGSGFNGYWFIPERQGSYIVNVIAEDIVGTQQKVSYVLRVDRSSSAAITEKVNLPKYLITGSEYTLPTLDAVNSNGQKTPCDIKIIDGGGERSYSGKTSFTPDENGNATIKYVSGANYYDYVIPVKVAKNTGGTLATYNFANFFETENVNAISESNRVRLFATSEGSAEFIRELLESNISVNLFVNSSQNDFSALTISLTDSFDASVCVSATIYNKGVAMCGLGCNGRNTGKSLSTVSFCNDKTLNFNYSGKRIIADGVMLSLNETVYGEEFNGFPSGKAYVKFSFEGVNGNSEVFITQINNQALKTTISDSAAPAVMIKGQYDRTLIKMGGKIKVLSALSGDVLEPNCTGSVSVTHNGSPVTAIDGTILGGVPMDREYEFIADKTGQYVILYTVRDSKNSARAQFVYQVYDFTAPTISLKTRIAQKYGMGKIDLPEVNVDENITTYVAVTDPYGNMLFLKGYSFEAKYKGTYIVRYVAFDGEGNTNSLTYKIGVE